MIKKPTVYRGYWVHRNGNLEATDYTPSRFKKLLMWFKESYWVSYART